MLISGSEQIQLNNTQQARIILIGKEVVFVNTLQQSVLIIVAFDQKIISFLFESQAKSEGNAYVVFSYLEICNDILARGKNEHAGNFISGHHILFVATEKNIFAFIASQDVFSFSANQGVLSVNIPLR